MLKKFILTAITIVISVCLSTGITNASIIQSGTGSYTDTLPNGVKCPPSTIYKTSNLSGAIPTSSWESSILFSKYSEAIYAHPLTFKYKSAGLEVGQPALGGGGVAYIGSHKNDFTIGHSAQSSFPDAKVDKISDFAVDTVMASESNSFKATLIKGSPYAYFTFSGGNPKLEFSVTPNVFIGNSSSQYLGITVNGVNYGLFAPAGASWTGIGTNTITCNLPTGKNYFSIAVLPDSKDETFTYFRAHAYAFITDTKAIWNYDEKTSTLTTKFSVITDVKEGSEQKSIMAIYPHQWKSLDGVSLLTYSYSTIRGKMKTIEGNSFSTKYTYNGILPYLPDNGSYDKSKLNSYLNELLSNMTSSSADTYWQGKFLGKLAEAMPIAKQIAPSNSEISSKIRETLENWFTAKSNEASNLFYYDKTWDSIIGYPASYGTDDQLNDHHFHYGYFINAAAQLALADPAWATKDNWGSMTEILIKDIANWDRTDTRFPYLRNFDPYEGHSWASGTALFADGNNQESSSEAINAWKSIILWGEATGNKTIRDLGIYLYTTETEAINNYWFDLDKDILEDSYGHNYASMLWGGKYCHEIWWDGTKSEVHGINFIPFTAASMYLGKNTEYVKSNFDEMLKESGSSTPPNWQDIQYMYYSLYDPATAKAMWNDTIIPESGESKLHTYHWICNLDGMGIPDFNVTADTPLYTVFNKNGIRTYVVYNASDVTKNITFSDGKTMTVKARDLATATSAEEETIKYGDVDGDSNINALDFALMKKKILGTIAEFPVKNPLKVSDLNGDGSFDALDFALMKKYLLGSVTSFPAEGQ